MTGEIRLQGSPIHSVLALPADANTFGIVYGGRIMHLMDMATAIVARRYTSTRISTAAVLALRFLNPIQVGDVMNFYAAVNRSFTSSLEVGCKVVAENTKTQNLVHAVSGYFLFVSQNEHGRPLAIPPFVPGDPDEKRRFQAADKRRHFLKSIG